MGKRWFIRFILEALRTLIDMTKQLTSSERKELDMVFSFDHLETTGHKRYDDYPYDLNYLKKFWLKSIRTLGNSCWQALFMENHDNPRMISKKVKRAAGGLSFILNRIIIFCTV